MKSRGPSMDPWGTPERILEMKDGEPSTFYENHLHSTSALRKTAPETGDNMNRNVIRQQAIKKWLVRNRVEGFCEISADRRMRIKKKKP